MLIHAPSKEGKSTLASTAPLPMLVLDVEGSWKFIRTAGFQSGVPLRKKRWNPLTEATPQYDGTWDVVVVNVRDYGTMEMVYRHLTQRPHQFVTVVIDSVTEVQRRCFMPDTELLTPTGWMRIDKITQGDIIAQYMSDTNAISFTEALDVQRILHNGDLVHVKTTFSDLAVTPDHRMLVKTDAGFTKECEADLLRVGYRVPVAGTLIGGEDPGISDDEVRLLAAIQADSYQATTNVFAFNLKKQRKQERLAQLCESTGTRYRRLPGRELGWEHFRVFRTPSIDKWVSEKTFRWEMLNWPEHQRRVFLTELGQWDGGVGPRGIFYSTTNDTNAEIVSALAVTTGYGVRTSTGYTRIGTPHHRLHLSDYSWRRVSAPRMIDRKHYEGDVHCITVPSGFVVTRRGGKTTIAGNCKANLKGTEQMQIQDWGALLNLMDSLVRGFRDLTLDESSVRCVVIISETKMKDGKWRPYAQGQLADSMPYWLDIMGWLYTTFTEDENGQPTKKRKVLHIGPAVQWYSGERVQGALPDAILDPNITTMLNTIFPPEPTATTAATTS